MSSPWIETPDEDEWGEVLASLRSDVVDPAHDRVDWIMRVHALDPESMATHNVVYKQAMKGTATLRRVEREMVALVVSKVNECHY